MWLLPSPLTLTLSLDRERDRKWTQTQNEGAGCRNGFRCLLRLPVKAHRVFPEHLPFLVAGQRFPSEEMVDRIGEAAFRMRIVGSVHQYAVTQELGHHLNHVFAFV